MDLGWISADSSQNESRILPPVAQDTQTGSFAASEPNSVAAIQYACVITSEQRADQDPPVSILDLNDIPDDIQSTPQLLPNNMQQGEAEDEAESYQWQWSSWEDWLTWNSWQWRDDDWRRYMMTTHWPPVAPMTACVDHKHSTHHCISVAPCADHKHSARKRKNACLYVM